MNLKEFALSRNMPQAKAKKLVQEILGVVPVTLSEDDIKKINEELGKASTNFLSESQDFVAGGELAEGTDERSLLPQTAENLEMTERVKEIVGTDLLKKNVLLYLSFLKQSFKEEKHKLDVAAFQVEQYYYSNLRHYQHSLYEDGRARIARASTEALRLFSPEGIKKEINSNEDAEMHDLLVEALSFFDEVG